MKQTKKEKPRKTLDKRKLLFIPVALVVLLALAFLFRGWFRMTVMPKTMNALYGDSTKKVMVEEGAKLQNPTTLLDAVPNGTREEDCSTFARGISTQITCTYIAKNYVVISQNPQAKATLNANAAKLQGLLAENGWEGEYTETGDYTSLKKLMTSLTNGIDYQPDATYRKQIGNIHCYFQTYTAFSTPNPPAFSSQLVCSRTFNILGTPSFMP